MTNVPDDPLDALAVALGLRFESQDWGIANADGARVAEFIAYYEARPDLTKALRHALGELIVASVNDALERGDAPPTVVAAFENFLARRHVDFPEVTEYWSSLDPDGFPVVRLMRPRR